MTSDAETSTRILCISWDPTLSETRELLLTRYGYKVTSALGARQSMELCSTRADLLLLGHSVPREEKQKILDCFRKFNNSPALSLLAPGQTKLLDVDYAVEYLNPGQLVKTVQAIIPARRI